MPFTHAELRPPLIIIDPVRSGRTRPGTLVRQFVCSFSAFFDFDSLAKGDRCEHSALLLLDVDVV